MPRTLRVAVLCAAFLLASPSVSAAYAASYLDEAVQALQTQNVYVSQLAGGVDAETREELEAQADDSNVGVVVLPADAVNEIDGSPSDFVIDVGRGTGYDTIVVSFGNDLQAGSSVLPQGVAGQLADQAEANNDSVGEAMLDFVAEVRTAQEQDSSTSEDDGSSLALPIGGLVVLLALLFAGVKFFTRGKTRPRGWEQRQELPELTVQGEVRAALEEMRSLASQIRDDPDIRENALTWSSRTDELVAEVSRLLPDRIHELSAGYAADIGRVNKVLRGYIKAQDKPYAVENPAKIKVDTRRSIAAYSDKVQKNLHRVNASEQLEFDMAVAMLAPPVLPPNRPQLDN